MNPIAIARYGMMAIQRPGPALRPGPGAAGVLNLEAMRCAEGGRPAVPEPAARRS